MITLSLSDLCDEDIAYTNIHAASFHWNHGSTTVYRNDGRGDNMFFYMMEGCRRYTFPDTPEVLDIREGDLMLMPAFSCYESTVLSEDGSKGICLQFTLLNGTGEKARLGSRPMLLRRESETPVHILMEKIRESSLQSGSRLHSKQLLMQLLITLCDLPAWNEHADIQPAIRYMEMHLDRTIALPEAASMCHMSQSSFTRRFRAAMGDSPVSYHRRMRLRKGRELLESGLYSVEEVALTLGFFDTPHFCHAYAAEYGETPSGHRTALTQNTAENADSMEPRECICR